MRSWPLVAVVMVVSLASCDRSPGASPSPSGSTSATDRVKDPVCGMMVDRATSIKRVYAGVEYFFCSEDCAKRFDGRPALFTVHCSCVNPKRPCSCDHCGGSTPCDCVK